MPTNQRMVQRGLSMPAEVWEWLDAEAARLGLKAPQLVRQATVTWMRAQRRDSGAQRRTRESQVSDVQERA